MFLPGKLILVRDIQINENFQSINSIHLRDFYDRIGIDIGHILGSLRIWINLEVKMELGDKTVNNS